LQIAKNSLSPLASLLSLSLCFSLQRESRQKPSWRSRHLLFYDIWLGENVASRRQ
jgi:hypothetical protein